MLTYASAILFFVLSLLNFYVYYGCLKMGMASINPESLVLEYSFSNLLESAVFPWAVIMLVLIIASAVLAVLALIKKEAVYGKILSVCAILFAIIGFYLIENPHFMTSYFVTVRNVFGFISSAEGVFALCYAVFCGGYVLSALSAAFPAIMDFVKKKERVFEMIYTFERICLPDNSAEQAVFASTELRYYFSMISGKPFAVGAEKENSVLLNQCETEELGEDGFKILPRENFVEIVGGKRGILYGTYELLELLGCRFFTPECEKIPTSENVTLKLDKEIFQKPFLEYREHNYIDLCAHPRFAVKCRVNGSYNVIPEKLGGHLTYAWYVHTVEKMLPLSKYAEAHPEYYALQPDGTRCTSRAVCQLCLSNPEVLEIAVESVRNALLENPQARIISISQNDTSHGNCQCEECRKIDLEEGSPSGLLLRFVNAIAERLEPEFPHVIFDTLAYTYSRPAPKITRPRKNVCVRLCSIEACFSHPFDTCDDETRHVTRPDGSKSSFIADLNAWGRVCERMYIWDYVTCFAHYPAPHPNWRTLQPNMKAFVRNNVRGILEQANGAKGGGTDLNEMRAYVISKLLWDAETDVEKHITEFSDYYYGAAGKYIRQYINLLCDKAEQDNIHVGFNDNLTSPLFAEEMLDKYDEILDNAENAVADDALRRRRVQKAKLSLRWVRLKRKAMFQNQFDREEINRFFLDWQSHGLTRIDEWVEAKSTLRALLDNKWRGVAYLKHFTDERGEIL